MLFVSHFAAIDNFIHILSNCLKLLVLSSLQHSMLALNVCVSLCVFVIRAHIHRGLERTYHVQDGRRKIVIQPIETHNCDFHFKRKIQFITYD